MKRYCMSFAASLEHKPEHPERTAKKSGTGMNMDVYYQVWNSRAAMLTTIELQQRGPTRSTHWRKCQ